jgi:hypothetical protein
MDPFRLDSVAPQVANRFRLAASNARRQATLLACEHCVAATGLSGADVERALEVLRSAALPSPGLRHRLEALAAELDEEYFRIDEDDAPGRKPEALRAFSKARAASALAFSLTENDACLHEAIYEAIAAIETPAPLVSLVDKVLGEL